ncbi:unnamed protein product [Prunus brigantina]
MEFKPEIIGLQIKRPFFIGLDGFNDLLATIGQAGEMLAVA